MALTLQLHPTAMSSVRNRAEPWAVVYHLMRGDLFERTRRYSFLITLGFAVFVAYLYLPLKPADYLTLGLGNYRGVYNSAWIGGAMAVLCSTLLSLPAFYLVKDAIERDRRTRVGQILATTPLSRPLYTLGKAFSNFVFLAVAVNFARAGKWSRRWSRSNAERRSGPFWLNSWTRGALLRRGDWI